jgi:hypothetical protein
MRTFAMSAILASALLGCGNKKCEELKTTLCTGLDDATCKAVRAVLDTELEKGPTDEKLSDGEKDLACKMILEDKEALEAYRKVTQERAKK